MTEGTAKLGIAYEGIDAVNSFPDARALEDYRQSLLERSRPQADFILDRLPADARVAEVACGNGRLLIEMAERGALAVGFGIDIAASRIGFAQRWAMDAGHNQLKFHAGDVFACELSDGPYDAAICITGAFGYFEPLVAGSALQLARKLYTATRPGGLLFLELYPAPYHRRLAEAAGGEGRVWKELPPEDPWRFYLSHIVLERDGEVVVHNKTFIHRQTGEVDTGRCERLFVYTPESIAALLADAGFVDTRAHEGWTETTYAGGESMVVTAQRPS